MGFRVFSDVGRWILGWFDFRMYSDVGVQGLGFVGWVVGFTVMLGARTVYSDVYSVYSDVGCTV